MSQTQIPEIDQLVEATDDFYVVEGKVEPLQMNKAV